MMIGDKITHRWSQQANPISFIKENLKNTQWMAIINIDGHLCVISTAEKNAFYLRDPFQGFLIRDSAENLKNYQITNDFIEVNLD